MSDAPAAAPAPAVKAKTPKKKAAPKKPAAHPTTAVMVAAAIAALKDKKGSSRAAIKKYIAANYKVDIVKLGPHLKKALKAGVGKKTLVVRDRLALPSRTTPCYHTTLKDYPGTQGFSLYQKFMIAHYL